MFLILKVQINICRQLDKKTNAYKMSDTLSTSWVKPTWSSSTVSGETHGILGIAGEYGL